MNEDEITGEASTQVPGTPAGAGDAAAADGGEFNPFLLIVLLGIALIVSIQNLWLRRRAQGKPLLPDSLSRRQR